MSEELRENKAFISFEGFIGRYDYFLNLVLLNMISLVFTTPITGYYLNGADNFNSLIDFTSCFTLAPIGVRIWSLIGSVIASYIIISNVIRRLNDINGGENKSMNYGISAVFVTLSFGYIFPSFLAILIYIFGTIVAFWVLLKKGKITGAMQYDYKKDFNWGAFFGTCIWGLVNKSYKTLWMLLLWCTPWGPLFGIYCGLKGNEWAGTNKDWDNLDQFQKSQKKQSIIFIILNVVIIPVVIFAITMTLIMGTVFYMTSSDDNNTQKVDKTIEKLESAMTTLGSIYFEGHEITKDENKYYVLSKDWSGYTFQEKKDILDMAASMASTEKNKAEKQTSKYSKTTELPKTKIYSYETKQLLGEFIMDKKVQENGSFKEYFSASMKAYQFYKPTK